jgi:diguanylate cyclase (GGDEF)-like protein
MDTKKQTILVVDDTETNIDILLELLSDYDVVVATNGLSAISIAKEEDINLLLLDIMMPEMDGYEVCARLKKDETTKKIPIIFITAKTDEDSIEKAYEVGGIDYVTKPFKPKELLARVRTQLEMQSLLQNLEYLASYDSMTGIYNRRKFFELSLKLFASHEKVFAIMIDIDKFKNINDTYGHPFGDKVIKEITQIIASHLTKDAIFGRLGGEEFAIVCEGNTIEEVNTMFENIRRAVENLEHITEMQEHVTSTISAGISQKHSSHESLDYLLKEADDALYSAKKSGRNKTVLRA